VARKKSATAKQHALERTVQWEVWARAVESANRGDQEFDNPAFVKKHPWVSDMVAGIRFVGSLKLGVMLDDHLNMTISIPNDLEDLSLWDDEITNVIRALADSVRAIEDRQREIVHEARRRGVTWTAIGDALGTTRQSAWGRYSDED
jgi:hypothetical protein